MSFEVNSFQIPNALIDSGLIANISPNELKCYLVVVRKTAGWHKEWDFIPNTQLMELTGIKKRQTIYSCMNKLEEYGLIESTKELGKTTKYKLKAVPIKGTSTKNGSSTVDGNKVVPIKGTGTSTVDGYTSKDTTKTTNTKDNKNKQKDLNTKVSFRTLLKEIRDLVQRKSKVDFTEKGFEEYKLISDKSQITNNYIKHQNIKEQYSQTIANFLIDYEANILELNSKNKSSQYKSTQQIVDERNKQEADYYTVEAE